MKGHTQHSDLIRIIYIPKKGKYAKREERNIQRNERKKRRKRKTKE
jgi:hypothetical protein